MANEQKEFRSEFCVLAANTHSSLLIQSDVQVFGHLSDVFSYNPHCICGVQGRFLPSSFAVGTEMFTRWDPALQSLRTQLYKATGDGQVCLLETLCKYVQWKAAWPWLSKCVNTTFHHSSTTWITSSHPRCIHLFFHILITWLLDNFSSLPLQSSIQAVDQFKKIWSMTCLVPPDSLAPCNWNFVGLNLPKEHCVTFFFSPNISSHSHFSST